MTTATKENHAEEQAQAQVESIVEMLRALNRESAAEDYTKGKSRKDCISLLKNAGLECTGTNEDLQDRLAEAVNEETVEPDDFEFDEDAARQTIQDDPLS